MSVHFPNIDAQARAARDEATAARDEATAARNTQRGKTQRRKIQKEKTQRRQNREEIRVRRKISKREKRGKTQVVNLVMAKIPVNGGEISKREKTSGKNEVVAIDLFTSDKSGENPPRPIPAHRWATERLVEITWVPMPVIEPRNETCGSGKQSGAFHVKGRHVCPTAGTSRPLR